MVHSTSPVGNRLLPQFLAAALPLLLGGCLELDQTMTLDKDGALAVRLEYTVDETVLPVLQEGRRLIDRWQGQADTGSDETGLGWLLSEEAAKKHFAGPGLRLVEHRVKPKGERRHVTVRCHATDGKRALNEGVFGDFSLSRAKTGDFVLRADLAASPDPVTRDGEAAAKLQALCRGLRIRLEIETPTPIVSTTGTRSGTRRAVWEFRVEDGGDADFLRRPPDIQVVFRGEGLRWE